MSPIDIPPKPDLWLPPKPAIIRASDDIETLEASLGGLLCAARRRTAGGGIATYATFDSALTGAPTLSGGDLTIADGQNNIAVSTIGLTSGKHAFAVEALGSNNEADWGFLLFSSGGPFSSGTAYNTYRTGTTGAIDQYTVNANVYDETSLVAAYGATIAAGEKLQWFVDIDAGDVFLAKDGTLLNSGTAIITGKTGKTWWPFAGTVGSGGTITGATADFGQTSFDPGSIKAGYLGWGT